MVTLTSLSRLESRHSLYNYYNTFHDVMDNSLINHNSLVDDPLSTRIAKA